MYKNNKFEIDVLDILRQDTGSSKREVVNFNASNIDEDVNLAKPVSGYIDLTNIGNSVDANFNLNTTIDLVCSRCLKNFSNKIILIFNIEYTDSRLDSEEIDIIKPNSKIDILEPIRQELLLSIPYKALCRNDCKGIKGIKITKE